MLFDRNINKRVPVNLTGNDNMFPQKHAIFPKLLYETKSIEKHVIGQGTLPYDLFAKSLFLLIATSGKPINNDNIILAGPSGTGKTETFRAIKEYFQEHIPKLPVSIRDMSSLTSEGYKGNDTEYIVQEVRGHTNGKENPV